MPVFGHAVVGVLLASWIHPQVQPLISPAAQPIVSRLWIPLVVALSYIPDISAQLVLLVGQRDIRVMTHSLIFALAIAGILAPVLAHNISRSVIWTFLYVLGCVLLHDILDLLQATDYPFLWPLSHHRTLSALAILPEGLRGEALVFSGGACFAWGLRRLIQQYQRLRNNPIQTSTSTIPRGWRVNSILIVFILLAAAGTHYLRDIREGQLETARILSQQQRAFDQALVLLRRAEQWPSTARPGRVDYLRGWIYEQLGNRQLAERYYRRSYEADPLYFWVVADLVLFYATSDAPLDVRQLAASPYVQHLCSHFSHHPEFAITVARLEQIFSRITCSSWHSPLPLAETPQP